MQKKEAVSDLFYLRLTLTVALLLISSCDCMVIVKSAHTLVCQYNVLSSISKYANDNFKENSREECEAFIEMLVAIL